MCFNALKTHCAAQKKKKIPLAVANMRLPWIPLLCKIQLQKHASETRPVTHRWGFRSRRFGHPSMLT